MKISISYPPLQGIKGTPMISQNRQYQVFSNPTYIYPMVPAYAASLLKQNGYEVFWDDGIAENLNYEDWLKRIVQEKPDIVAIETKTPVIKRHWKIINDLKLQTTNYPEGEQAPYGAGKLQTVLMGDHVTALPQESLQNSQVDFVLTGGDYDFMLLNLANHLAKAEPLEPGWYYKNSKLKTQNSKLKKFTLEGDEIISTGPFKLNHNLDALPMIDRDLTKWRLYAFKNGNFKRTPGSYMMSARDCWWGKCSFCSWTTLFPGVHFRTRSTQKALDEVGELIKLGVKEIFEDSGSLPIGSWLEEFCQGMIERGYGRRVVVSCNMRINGIKDPAVWQMMKKAGFRMILFGLESANQATLDKINKNLKVEETEPMLKMCKEAGLEPHITAMLGYPWETKADAQRTVDLAKSLFKNGYVDTLQATIVIPYPGTMLYKYCQENNLLNFNDYDRFDQREQVMKSELTSEDVKALTRDLYKSFASPQFIARKILSIRCLDDIKFLTRAAVKLMGHLTDFGGNKQ